MNVHDLMVHHGVIMIYIIRGELFQPLSWMLSFAKSDDLEALQKYVHLYISNYEHFFFLFLSFLRGRTSYLAV
jgi:hypothetical protein